MSFGKLKKLKPLRPCISCWETFDPYTYNMKYCSKRCRLNESNRRVAIIKEKALINGTGGAFLKLRFTILRRDKFTCQYCGRNAQNGAILHIDHIIPFSKGGKTTLENLVTSCFECNEGKSDVILSEREQKKLKSQVGILCP